MTIFEVQSTIGLVILLVVLAIKAFAFVSALLYPAEAYEAAGKLTKASWCAITGLGLATALMPIALLGGLLGIIFLIAALVYLADVRPALQDMVGRRR